MGVARDFAKIILPPVLSRFALRYPAISFDVRVTDVRATDHMVSFYGATPSGFAVELGWGARDVAPLSQSLRSPSREARDDHQQLGGLDGFDDVHVETRPQSLHPVFRSRVGGQRYGGRSRPALRFQRADLRDERVTVFPRHADVADEDVGPLRLQSLQRLRGGRRGADEGAALLQHMLDEIARIDLVVDDHHPQAAEADASFGSG